MVFDRIPWMTKQPINNTFRKSRFAHCSHWIELKFLDKRLSVQHQLYLHVLIMARSMLCDKKSLEADTNDCQNRNWWRRLNAFHVVSMWFHLSLAHLFYFILHEIIESKVYEYTFRCWNLSHKPNVCSKFDLMWTLIHFHIGRFCGSSQYLFYHAH